MNNTGTTEAAEYRKLMDDLDQIMEDAIDADIENKGIEELAHAEEEDNEAADPAGEAAISEDKNWIKDAIKKPGSLTKTAKAEGGVYKQGENKGEIKKSWLDKEAKGKGKTAQRARLAKTLKSFKK